MQNNIPPSLLEEVRRCVRLMTCLCCETPIEYIADTAGCEYCPECDRTYCGSCIKELRNVFNITHHGVICFLDKKKPREECVTPLCSGRPRPKNTHCDFCMARLWFGFKINISLKRVGDYNPESFGALYNITQGKIFSFLLFPKIFQKWG